MSPKKLFSQKDWDKVRRRIERSQDRLASKPSEEDLDDCVIDLWICGEYLVNVCLELRGEKPRVDHTQHKLARDLKARGELTKDYYKSLEMLQRFRKKAGYLGYSKTTRTVHYNSIAVQGCLVDIESLFAETEEKLKNEGQL